MKTVYTSKARKTEYDTVNMLSELRNMNLSVRGRPVELGSMIESSSMCMYEDTRRSSVQSEAMSLQTTTTQGSLSYEKLL